MDKVRYALSESRREIEHMFYLLDQDLWRKDFEKPLFSTSFIVESDSIWEACNLIVGIKRRDALYKSEFNFLMDLKLNSIKLTHYRVGDGFKKAEEADFVNEIDNIVVNCIKEMNI